MPFVDNALSTATGNVALTTAEAGLFSGPIPLQGTGPGRVAPVAIVMVTVPNITGIATTASVTVNVRSGTSSGGTLFGSGTITNPGAGTSAVGPVTVTALVPAGTQDVFVGALTSSGTGTAVASATAPITFAAIYLD